MRLASIASNSPSYELGLSPMMSTSTCIISFWRMAIKPPSMTSIMESELGSSTFCTDPSV